MKEKHSKNNAKHENDQVQKEAQQVSQHNICSQMKRWSTNLLKGSDDWKTNEVEKHNMNEQRWKIKTTCLLLFKTFGRWTYTKCYWRCLLHSFEAPLYGDGHPKWFEYHAPLHHNRPVIIMPN